jgi:hypothetical protein
MVLVELIGFFSYLGDDLLCWLLLGVASVRCLLFEPPYKLWQLYVSLKPTDRIQEDQKYILCERRRGRGRIFLLKLLLFLRKSLVAHHLNVVTLIIRIEDDIVLHRLLGLLQCFVTLSGLEYCLRNVSVRPLILTRIL